MRLPKCLYLGHDASDFSDSHRQIRIGMHRQPFTPRALLLSCKSQNHIRCESEVNGEKTALHMFRYVTSFDTFLPTLKLINNTP